MKKYGKEDHTDKNCSDAGDPGRHRFARAAADKKIKEIKEHLPRCGRMPIDKLMQIVIAYSEFLETAR